MKTCWDCGWLIEGASLQCEAGKCLMSREEAQHRAESCAARWPVRTEQAEETTREVELVHWRKVLGTWMAECSHCGTRQSARSILCRGCGGVIRRRKR